MEIHITLTEEEGDLFLMMQGMAVGVAMRDDNVKLSHALLRLTNKLNAGKPDFEPYAVPEEQGSADSEQPSAPSQQLKADSEFRRNP